MADPDYSDDELLSAMKAPKSSTATLSKQPAATKDYSDDELLKAMKAPSSPKPKSDFGAAVGETLKGVGAGITGLLDIPRALTPQTGPYANQPIGPSGIPAMLPPNYGKGPQPPPGPTLTQQYQRATGQPNPNIAVKGPFGINLPFYDLGKGISTAAGVAATGAPAELAPGLKGPAGWAANTVGGNALYGGAAETADEAAAGQRLNPAQIATSALGAGAAGGIVNPILGSVAKGTGGVVKDVWNKLMSKGDVQGGIDQVQNSLQEAQARQAAEQVEQAPEVAPQQPQQPIDEQSTSNKADKFRAPITDRWKPMLDAKLQAEQYEENQHQSVNAYANRLKQLYGDAAANVRRSKNVVIRNKVLAQLAALDEGLDINRIKRVPTYQDINVKRRAGSPGPNPYKPHETATLDQLAATAEFWRRRKLAAQKRYEAVRDALKLHNELPLGGTVNVEHVDKNGVKRVYAVNRRQQTEYKYQGTAEEQERFKARKKEYNAKETAEEQAADFARRGEASLEPAFKGLKAEVAKHNKPLAKAMGKKEPITADPEVMKRAKEEGVLDEWKAMYRSLIDQDKIIRTTLGVGSIVAGQALSQRAEAKTPGEETQDDMARLGVAFTLFGAATLASRSKTGREYFDRAMHIAWSIPGEFLVKRLRQGMARQARFSENFKGVLHGISATNANWDVIERNSQTDAHFLAAMESLRNQWFQHVSGEGIVPEPSAPAAVQQQFLRGMFSSSQGIGKLNLLTPTQRTRLYQLAAVRKQGATLIDKEIKRLQGDDRDAMPVGNKALVEMLKMEKIANWGGGKALSNDDVIGMLVHGLVQAVQLMGFNLHLGHAIEGATAVGSRLPGHYQLAVSLIARRDPEALRLGKTLNIKLPVYGNLEDTESGIIDKATAAVEKALNKATNGAYQIAKESKPLAQTKDILSGRAIEQHAKVLPAVIAGSEQAAGILKYPGGGNALRKDLNDWLNGQAKPGFDEPTGLAALGVIRSLLEDSIGAGPAGFRVALSIDRAAQHRWGSLAKAMMPFMRTPLIATRSLAKLAGVAAEAIEQGDYVRAGIATRAFFLTIGMLGLVTGNFLPKEANEAMVANDPVNALKMHKAMDAWAVLGDVPGALGMPDLNFRTPHFQYAAAPLLQGGKSLLASDLDNLFVLLNSKKKGSQRLRALIALAAQAGITSIGDTISYANAYKIFKAYQDAEQNGGIDYYTFGPELPIVGNAVLPPGGALGLKRPEENFINSHFVKRAPAEAAFQKGFMPGLPKEVEEKTFNDLAQHYAEALVITKYGKEFHDDAKAQLAPYIEKWLRREALAKKGSRRTDEENAEWEDVGGSNRSAVEEESEGKMTLEGYTFPIAEFWTMMLEHGPSKDWLATHDK